MPFIRTIPPNEAIGALKELYEGDLAAGGQRARVIEAWSLRADVLAAWNALIAAIASHLDLRRFELITVVAAAPEAAGCRDQRDVDDLSVIQAMGATRSATSRPDRCWSGPSRSSASAPFRPSWWVAVTQPGGAHDGGPALSASSAPPSKMSAPRNT